MMNFLRHIILYLFPIFCSVMPAWAAEPSPSQPLSYLSLLVGAVVLALLIILGIWVWNLKLRALVARRTRALTKSESLLRAILDASPVGIGMTSKDRRFLGWHNRAMTEILGYESGELEGHHANIIYCNESACREAGQRIKALLNSGLNTPIEVQWRRKDGSFFDCRFRYAPFTYGGEEHAIVIAVDISDSKRAERELVKSERRLRAILESSPDPIVVYDEEGKPTYINLAFTRLFGWSFAEIKDALIPFVPEDQLEITRRKIVELLQSGQSLSFETQRYNKAGERLDVLVNAATVKDVDSDEFSSLVVNLTDLTDKIKLERRLLQAEKMELVGTLAGGIAHDFNNILTVINGFSEIGEHKAGRGEVTLKEHQQVQAAAERARNLVVQLLTFSRQSEPVTRTFALKQMVEESLSMIERIIPRMIKLEFSCDTGVASFINGDVNQLNQIMLNLCLNAVDAMPDGGLIVIKIENINVEELNCSACYTPFSGDYVRLQVRDAGQGIDKVTLQNIFVPFYTTKEVGKGTGLGLSTVFGIVRNHSGHIVCQSEVGVGTVFDIFFPVVVEPLPEVADSAPAETAALTPVQAESGAVKPETILVVDDEEVIRDFVRESMEFYGYRVMTAVSGEEALELYRQSPAEIDLVLLDISMPGMGGLKCLEELLKINPDIRVIIASGYFADGLENDPLQQGASDFLNKPYKIKALLDKIRSVID